MDEIDKRLKAVGADASKLRRRKYELQREHGLSGALMPGSLTQTSRRCGKSTCRCAGGAGHPVWIFSYSVCGRRRAVTVPLSELGALRELLEASGRQRAAVAEVMQINAKLFELWRNQGQDTRRKKRENSKKLSAGDQLKRTACR
jgi:hypothetical protein